MSIDQRDEPAAADPAAEAVWAPQLERSVYDHELHVPAAATTVPLDQQAATAKALVPDGTLTGVRPGPTPTDTTQVIFTRPGLEPSFHWTVFVDPHTGDVRGQLETYGSGQAMPVRSWIDVLHRSFHLGDFGRLYSELAASWLWVVTLAGLALWFGRRRRKRAAAPSPRAKLLTWHGRTGLVLAIGFDGAREATLRAGLTDPVEVRPPTGPGKEYVVAQVGRSWPVQADSMAVDPATGTITDTLRFADYNLAAKLSTWGSTRTWASSSGSGTRLR